MQSRSIRRSGEPAWVNALSSACERLGPDPRRALGPAATPAASTGRTRDRTRPMLQLRQKVLARAPSTRDPKRTCAHSDVTSASLIGRLGSSAFRLSTTTVSMSLTGSCFSSESALRPLYGAFFVKEFARAAHLFLRRFLDLISKSVSSSRPAHR